MNESDLREQRVHAAAVLAAFGSVPRPWRRHTGCYVRAAHRSLTDSEIARLLGLSEEEVRREYAAGGQG
ncbi:hypothetical protein [Nocardia sp. BMG51109]|uniref:hypothetical protein n=1 Tax=Nocardia sp. BMG51109 TaxID=1056816 RepID=UPI0012EB9E7F|nr:hypothetical protein [Nocardia sp. BMG51109]